MSYLSNQKILHHNGRKFYEELIVLIGNLVVVGLVMLMTSATSSKAQEGQDPRCTRLTGQAFGLCTAAASAGCFDGIQPDECDNLNDIWMNECSVCGDGVAPWVCPCAVEGNALDLHELFVTNIATAPQVTGCIDNNLQSILNVEDPPFTATTALVLRASHFTSTCLYRIVQNGENVVFQIELLFGDEITRCQNDMRKLMNQLPGCP